MRVGLFGAGAIGQTIARALDSGGMHATLAGICDVEREKAERFAATLESAAPVVTAAELAVRSDLIVESASQGALPEIVAQALAHGKDLLVMSVGGLIGHEEWFDEAQARGARIYVPSGAIAGLDGIKAAARGRLDAVTLTSKKPVAALRGSKYVTEQGIALDALREPTVIFEGRPEEACRAFPATSNVAASLRLAAGAHVNVTVRVMADPRSAENVHEIEARGDFGRLHMRVENVPSPANPRTSQLAALSALALLEQITSRRSIGT